MAARATFHEGLSGPQRAAVILLTLGEEYGKAIWRSFDEDEIRIVSSAMSQLGSIESNMVEELIVEFVSKMSATGAQASARQTKNRRMKKFLPNLLIAFAMILCALCAYQWKRETGLRGEIKGLHDKIYDRDVQISQLQVNIKKGEADINRLEERIKDLNEVIKTNKAEVIVLRKANFKVEQELGTANASLEAYKGAVEKQNKAIETVNKTVVEQNETIKRVVDERNDLATKFGETVKKHNEVVAEYNKLAEEYKKLAESIQQANDPKKDKEKK